MSVRRPRGAGGPGAFVILELFLTTLRRRPGSGASQLALSCPRISPARPIFLCCLLAPVKEPAWVLFALTLPVPSRSRSAASPASGQATLGQRLRPLPIAWLWGMRSGSALRLKSPQPLPVRFISFFFFSLPDVGNSQLPAAVGWLCPPRDRGRCPAWVPRCHRWLLGFPGAWPARAALGPRRWDRGVGTAALSLSREGGSGFPFSITTFGWAAAVGQPPLLPFHLLRLIPGALF